MVPQFSHTMELVQLYNPVWTKLPFIKIFGLYLHAHTCAFHLGCLGAHKSQKWASVPLKMELQVFMSHCSQHVMRALGHRVFSKLIGLWFIHLSSTNSLLFCVTVSFTYIPFWSQRIGVKLAADSGIKEASITDKQWCFCCQAIRQGMNTYTCGEKWALLNI